MRYLPEWLVKSVLSDPFSMQPRVEWSIDKVTWHPLRVLSGSHSEDATSQTRWTMSGTFARDYPVSELGIHPYGCRLRVWMDIKVLHNSYSIQFGEYVITKVSETDEQISISGASLEEEIIESEFSKPRRIPDKQYTTFRTQAETLIREAVPDARFVWHDDLKVPNTRIPRAFYDTTRWAVIDGDGTADSIMNALGGVCYCDFSGAFNFAAIPRLDKPPVWTVKSGDVKISSAADLDREGIKNVLTVAADSYTGDGAGPAFAWDDDPNSITYAGPDPINNPGVGAGPYGVKAVKYTNSLINSDGMAAQVANSRINDYLGFRKSVSFDAKFHPGLQCGDVVAVENAEGRLEPYMLDSIGYSWGDATVTCQTRSTKAGDLSNAVS